MKRSHRLAALGISLLCVGVGIALIVTTTSTAQPPREERWKKVDDAVKKGLPRTAIAELEPIIEAAIKDKAYPEAIKAITQKINLEGNIQGNKPEEKITRLQAAINTSPAEMHPVMHAVLAHWYWHYFQQNRHRFLQRTSAGDATGDDITTWDLPRILGEIDAQFTKALANEKELKAIPVATYAAFLEKGTIPDAFRPTLWDLLAFDAISFYASGEQAGAKAEDSFEIAAASPVFGSVDEFLQWNPETTDTKSSTLKAVRLFQQLLAFHKGDADQSAFLDTDLHRLRFGHNKAVGSTKSANYQAALKAFIAANAGHELSSMARYQLAGELQREGKLVDAREVASAGRQAFPASPGGLLCDNTVKDIEAPAAHATTERVWAEPMPAIKVNYKNVTKVHFRLVKSDYTDRLRKSRWRPEQLDQAEQQALLREKPVRVFEHDLPATEDYQARDEYIPAPKGIAPGFYYLISSHDADFGANGNVVNYCDVWVSDLAIVTRNDYRSGRVQGMVLQGTSGEPIEGAKVQVWVRNNNGGYGPGEMVNTNADGMFDAVGQNGHSHLVLVTNKEQQLSSAHDLYANKGSHNISPHESTVFFTDRALYRPGQMVQFKGICIRSDQGADKYTTIADRNLTVVFADQNGKEIERQQVRTNDYGSFHGSFTAPRDRLTGRMNIQVAGLPHGLAQISVEEYKRPKFQVKVEVPKEAFKINDAVTVTGKATAYTGVPIGGAKVRYRVVREVRYPPWFHMYCWWRPVPNIPAQEIAHGFAATDPDGNFSVTFTARPDLSVPEKDDPSFRYTISADVTDTTGETRSNSKSIEVGYTALRATVSVPDWIVANEETTLTINTTTLDGEGQAAKGTVKVFALVQPKSPVRGELDGGNRYYHLPAGAEPKPDPSRPVSWAEGEAVFTADFSTEGSGKLELKAKLPAGIYRAVVNTTDKFGKPVTAKTQVQVVNPAAAKFNITIPNLVMSPKWTVEPGNDFVMLWGTGYDKGQAFIEVEHRGKILTSFWTDAGKTQDVLKVPVTEEMRGGFTVRVTYVRENRAYLTSHHVNVPWTNKNLAVKWERFVNKMEPGQKETFTAVITGPDAKVAAAEFVAAMYDASLDAYLPHHWQQGFGVFRQDHSSLNLQFENVPRHLQHLQGAWPHDRNNVALTYRGFPAEVTMNYYRYEYFGKGGGYEMGNVPWGRGRGGFGGEMATKSMPAAPVPTSNLAKADSKQAEAQDALGGGAAIPDPADASNGASPGPNLNNVSPRTNLNETAFFLPQLTSDAEGVVRITFTMPEALTKWKFMGFAHDQTLRAGYLQDEAVTAKDLMCEPNPPRFLREGDIIEFTAKVSNRSATKQKGQVRLSMKDARTDKPVDAELGLVNPDIDFDLAAGESRSFSWKLTVADGTGPLVYRVVAASERLSDGEEGPLPVLSRRVLVQESLPLPIRGAGTKQFEFTKLKKSGESETIRSQSYTIQMVSQPAWYAVLALPYLMEYPHECSEQTFNRLYANSLARHIASSDPKIRKVFDQWKNTLALDSPLEKNQDLKAVTIEETPWLRQAQSESQSRRNVGILFDDNRLNDEMNRATKKLADMQYADGSWPWFPGAPGNDYITLYITTGYARLRHLGAKPDMTAALKSLTRLDDWANKQYHWAMAHEPEKNHLSSTLALYLYCRSFYLQDKPIDAGTKPMIDYWMSQAKTYWLQLPIRQSQGHLALATHRLGDKATAAGIMKSIKERSVSNEEMGMFWRDLELSYSWFHAPIETQALMIEAFDEVANDAQAVEDCKVWLLKTKQTTDWKTTKATADAVYALLLRGDNLLKSDALVEVTVGGQKIVPEKVEAGTGFYEHKFIRNEITPSMGNITLKKTDPGVSWGSAHWQYLEDISKVTPHEGTPLKLEKRLFKRSFGKAGPQLTPVANQPIGVGDDIVVRIVLRTDRDMEYVHMKDHRGSGTEPTNVLSRYKFQDGLGYYESTKDTASHFFIDYLPKGTYVFEYAVRVQHKGKYPTGFAHIECMYAPEFNSHSENINLDVK